MHMSSMLNQDCFLSGLLHGDGELHYLLPRKLKNPHLFYSYGMGPPRDPFRNCKTIKREHRFRFLGHIPHILVDDGALFAFSLSETRKTTSVH